VTTECAYCYCESDRLIEPPILRVLRCELHGYEGEGQVYWRIPGQAFPGPDLYDILSSDDSAVYLRLWETPDKPLCYRCYAGQVIPAAESYLHNKPPQLRFNGWLEPVWKE
jgi:hypothetical protein